MSQYETIKVEKEDGIAFVVFNRPEKRNAMNPTMHYEMDAVLPELESDPETKVVVLTGAGESFCAGQDLKEYFRELDDKPVERRRVSEASERWRHRRLVGYNKPTIAMVNGYCVGGGFTQVISCDLALAAEEATFSLSEVSWGILPGGLVSKKISDTLRPRDAMYYAMTGLPFDGRKAAEIGLVNVAYPKSALKEETVKLANILMEKNPEVLRATKQAVRQVRWMTDDEALDYLAAKGAEIKMRDKEDAYGSGIRQFVDEKKYKPTFESAPRAKAPR